MAINFHFYPPQSKNKVWLSTYPHLAKNETIDFFVDTTTGEIKKLGPEGLAKVKEKQDKLYCELYPNLCI